MANTTIGDQSLMTKHQPVVYETRVIVDDDTPVEARTVPAHAWLTVGHTGHGSLVIAETGCDTGIEGLDLLERFFLRCLDAVYAAQENAVPICDACDGHGEHATADPVITETCAACGGTGAAR
jgi:hypothetical protein